MAVVMASERGDEGASSKRTLPPEVRKAQLLAAARKILATNGFSRMRVSDVVAEAKLSQGSFYLYFGGKDDLVIELIGMMIGEAATALDAIGIEQLEMEPGLRRLLEVYYRVCFAYRDVLDNIDVGTSAGVDRRKWNEAFEPLNEFTMGVITSWQSRGHIGSTVPANVLSWLFIDTINGGLSRLFGHSLDRVSPDYAERIGDWILAALRGIAPPAL